MTGHQVASVLAIGAGRGGVADVFARVTRELRERGHTMTVWPAPVGGAPGAAGLLMAWRGRRELRGAELVHLEFGANDTGVFWLALAATCLRRDCVVVAHDYPELAHAPAAGLLPTRPRLAGALARRLLSPLLDGVLTRLIIRRAGVLVSFGPLAVQGLRGRGGREVVEVRHGGDPPSGPALAPSRGEHILFAGFIGPGKGVDVLLAAWQQVGAELGLPLVLAGAAESPNDRWFDELMRAGDAGPNPPRRLGHVAGEAGFQALIERAALVVLPYRRSNPASGILVRAMHAGRAVLATPVPATHGVIESGVNGVLVPAGDAQALAKALVELAGDPELRDRLGRAAAVTAAREFTWARHAEGLEGAYARAMQRRQR